MNSTLKNKTIIKNSIYLYIRMLITMGVGLYTSRVILEALGEVDFGLYNVISGVVIFISFISTALSNSTSRFITFSLGKQDNKQDLENIFRSTFSIHIIIAIIVFLLLETIGLYLFYQLNIPSGKEIVCFWVYQYAIFSTVLSLLVVPFSSAIIAHEKMDIYAYTSLIDVFLKLFVAFVVSYTSFDHLFVYSTLVFGVNILNVIINIIYCYKKFPETSVQWLFNRKYVLPILKYCSWIIIGHFSWLLSTQGLNYLLNIFCGPAVNAARALSIQIQSVLSRFVQGFQTALNPQITKSYASGDLQYMHILIFNSSRYSFLILFVCSAPLYISTDFFLNLWLDKVPEYTIQLVKILLIGNLLDSLINPLVISINSTGKMKSTQLTQSIIYFILFGVQWLILSSYQDPVMAFIAYYVSLFIIYVFRLMILRKKINLSIKRYIINVCIPLFKTLIFSIIIFIIYNKITNLSEVINAIIIIIISFSLAWIVGLKSSEKELILQNCKKYIKR